MDCCPSTTWRSSTRRTRSRRSPASTWACRSPASASISRWRGCTTSGRQRAARGSTSSTQRSLKSSGRATAADDFFDRVADWYRTPAYGFNGRVRKPLGWPEILPEELRKLATAIQRRRTTIEKPEDRIELDAAEERCRSLADQISAWLQSSGVRHRLLGRAGEQDPDSRPARRGAAGRGAATCASLLFDKVPTCVLTSATLCVGSPPRFDFIKSRLGLDVAETLALGSPFDYARQVTVHLPRNLPDPSDQPDSFERAAIRAIAHYLEQTHGKAFVLFTSYKMLEAAARALTPWLARRNIALFAQSDGMPRSKMVDAFKADINSVIFGADSFWQGVDVPGEALSNVIITRLPFSVPSHPAPGGPARGHPPPRRQPVHRIPGPRSRHQAQAGLRPADPHQDRPGDRRDPRPARAHQALRPHLLELAAACPRIVETPPFGDAAF